MPGYPQNANTMPKSAQENYVFHFFLFLLLLKSCLLSELKIYWIKYYRISIAPYGRSFRDARQACVNERLAQGRYLWQRGGRQSNLLVASPAPYPLCHRATRLSLSTSVGLLNHNDTAMTACVAGIDTSVHFQSSHPASGSAGPVSVDDVYHGTKAALSAGNTTVGQLYSLLRHLIMLGPVG